MSLKITEECINCGACEPECPNNAIYEGSKEWTISDGTKIKGFIINKLGIKIDVNCLQKPKKYDYYFIVPEKCTECLGFYDEPQCASVCPVDCCILDESNIESKEELLKKKKKLHT
ncbi:3Fe-4S ferredoxin:4Fe-4S ferredoxin, iron-sulfur binding domain protein [Candidatus Karelsulcia muelleri CARI]|uniref:3Fe-4S ferredoxin:4Fe-4S ferredoxin, iron-sulfur binding domain protein n=1 Tax=Karelsulcia muelleri (strain CARI) TaxID=706194 RepID=E0TJI6_KARMC|nr:3Fe-4S ferredoxin:4Fe-4S ferredoxin, iron-sulfur binding domain protein [Candidatus Karelsulcia muelleri CARI]